MNEWFIFNLVTQKAYNKLNIIVNMIYINNIHIIDTDMCVWNIFYTRGIMGKHYILACVMTIDNKEAIKLAKTPGHQHCVFYVITWNY